MNGTEPADATIFLVQSDDADRMMRIVRRLLRLRERIENMNKGCIVIDFAGDRETIKVTEMIEE